MFLLLDLSVFCQSLFKLFFHAVDGAVEGHALSLEGLEGGLLDLDDGSSQLYVFLQQRLCGGIIQHNYTDNEKKWIMKSRYSEASQLRFL